MTAQEALNYLRFRLTEAEGKNNSVEVSRYQRLIEAFLADHKLTN